MNARSSHLVPRFATGPRELEDLLETAARAKPSRRIAIIVDGLDPSPRAEQQTESAEELAVDSSPGRRGDCRIAARRTPD